MQRCLHSADGSDGGSPEALGVRQLGTITRYSNNEVQQ